MRLLSMLLGAVVGFAVFGLLAQRASISEHEIAPKSVIWGQESDTYRKCEVEGQVLFYGTLRVKMPGRTVDKIKLKAAYCEGGQWLPKSVLVEFVQLQ